LQWEACHLWKKTQENTNAFVKIMHFCIIHLVT
jgi:hypothetical protein